ncbi:MAG: hypothetical protein HZA46_05790 [Planctomycetales bacterium]|nr:hypothetical protein [Planctomycetales bacterium]
MAKSRDHASDTSKTADSTPNSINQWNPAAPIAGSASTVQSYHCPIGTKLPGDDLFLARDELESRLGGLSAFTASATATRSRGASAGHENILAWGISEKSTNGGLTGDLCVKVYVRNKLSSSRVHAAAAIPGEINGIHTDVESVGEVVAFDNVRHQRPVPCGSSIGHRLVTAGTLGTLVVRNNGNLCLLSNNHVIAAENGATIGDPIVQPGVRDGGLEPGDVIGHLEDFVPINFGGQNFVDAAVAFTAFTHVSPLSINPLPVSPAIHLSVRKTGRTTDTTAGVIVGLGFNGWIGYQRGRAFFRNQVVIQGIGGAFSRRGDSGSLIITAGSSQPVALLFAGDESSGITFGTPIGTVMSALGINRFV